MQLDTNLSKSIDEAVDHYFNDSISLVDGLTFSQYQTIRKVEFYSNSKYLNGQKDNLGRVKPFYNINNFRVQIAVRATDLDIKNINIEADQPEDSFKANLLNQELYNWMKDTNFSKTLNDLGQIRPRYGGVLAKRVEKEGDVHIEAVAWKNIITDQTNILEGITIERHFFSPSKLSSKRDVWKNIDEALKLASKKKGDSTDPYEMQSNIPQVEVWEVYMDVQKGKKFIPTQMIIATNGKDKVLMHEQEKEKPYKYLPWEAISGRGLGRGQVEDGFEAQMWTNDAVIAQKNAMDLAGKVIITSNSNELEGNALTDIDNGTIIPLRDNGFFNSTQLLPSALPELSNMIDQWDKQYSEVASSYNAISGEEMPSGTPFRSLALQSKQSASYFDYKREEFGIFIREIIEDWILPELTKRLSRPHTLVTQLDGEKLELLDDLIVASRLEEGIKKYVKKNKVPPTHEQVERERQRLIEHLTQTGNTRYLDIPQGYYKGIKTKVSVITTGEQKDKEALNDRLIGMAELAFQTGNVDLGNKLMKRILDNSDVGIASQEIEAPQAPSQSSVNTSGGTPAVNKEIDNALPVAQST